MIIKTSALSLRLGRIACWKSSKTSKTLYYFEHHILLYCRYIFGYLSKSKYYRRIFPIFSKPLLGTINFRASTNSFIIYINYYLELKTSFFSKRFLFLANRLSILFGVKIIIKVQNYYLFVLSPIKSIKRVPLQVLHRKEITYFLSLSKLYLCIKNKLSRFKKNTYYLRILNVFFTLFLYKNFDTKLFLNAIALELSVLRRRHSPFLKFLTEVLDLFFVRFNKITNISGLTLLIKGRLTPFNRQAPHAIKKIFKFGIVIKSNYDDQVLSDSVVAVSRFGTINIELCWQRKLSKHVVPTTDISPLPISALKGTSTYLYFLRGCSSLLSLSNSYCLSRGPSLYCLSRATLFNGLFGLSSYYMTPYKYLQLRMLLAGYRRSLYLTAHRIYSLYNPSALLELTTLFRGIISLSGYLLFMSSSCRDIYYIFFSNSLFAFPTAHKLMLSTLSTFDVSLYTKKYNILGMKKLYSLGLSILSFTSLLKLKYYLRHSIEYNSSLLLILLTKCMYYLHLFLLPSFLLVDNYLPLLILLLQKHYGTGRFNSLLLSSKRVEEITASKLGFYRGFSLYS